MAKRFGTTVIVDPEIWKQFKATCVLKGVDMSGKIQELIIKWLDEQGWVSTTVLKDDKTENNK